MDLLPVVLGTEPGALEMLGKLSINYLSILSKLFPFLSAQRHLYNHEAIVPYSLP